MDKNINSHDFELKLYEKLGVKQFKNLTFCLEKKVNKSENHKNINYHAKGFSIEEMENFKKYLYLNGMIHVKNIIILLIALVVILLLPISSALMLIAIPFLLKDLYCIMLQRYNYIRFNKVINKKQNCISRRQEEIKSNVLKNINQREKDKYLTANKEFIEKLEKFLKNESDIDLDEFNIEDLKAFQEVIEFTRNSRKKMVEINENINFDIKERKLKYER